MTVSAVIHLHDVVAAKLQAQPGRIDVQFVEKMVFVKVLLKSADLQICRLISAGFDTRLSNRVYKAGRRETGRY